ncbi:hypothetical protein N9399_05705, partial [Porticoccaceae bacterium]|nr:hypothetical protein [Porticoccaceae bacterium]
CAVYWGFCGCSFFAFLYSGTCIFSLGEVLLEMAEPRLQAGLVPQACALELQAPWAPSTVVF